MAEAGAMVIEWAVLDAQYFGVPQRRRRVFVIAIFDPVLAKRCPETLLPVSESLPRHLAKGKPARKSAASKTATGIGTDGAWWDGRDTAKALTTTSNKQRFQAVVEQDVVGALAARDYKGVGNQYVAENKLVTEAIIGFSHTQGLDAQPSEKAWPTLRKEGSGHAVLTTMAVRRLTPLECERLMGWPDDHTRYKADGTEQADTHRYKQCGNGVASPVAQWIAKHLLKI